MCRYIFCNEVKLLSWGGMMFVKLLFWRFRVLRFFSLLILGGIVFLNVLLFWLWMRRDVIVVVLFNDVGRELLKLLLCIYIFFILGNLDSVFKFVYEDKLIYELLVVLVVV